MFTPNSSSTKARKSGDDPLVARNLTKSVICSFGVCRQTRSHCAICILNMNFSVLLLATALCIEGSSEASYGSTQGQDVTPESSKALEALRQLRQDITVTLTQIDDDPQTSLDENASDQIQQTLASSGALGRLRQLQQEWSTTSVGPATDEDEEQAVSTTTCSKSREEDRAPELVSQDPKGLSVSSVDTQILTQSKSDAFPKQVTASETLGWEAESSVLSEGFTPEPRKPETLTNLSFVGDFGRGFVSAGTTPQKSVKPKFTRVPSAKGRKMPNNSDYQSDRGGRGCSDQIHRF